MSGEVPVVHHVHVHDEGREDLKLVGVYSSAARAAEAIARARLLPGFRDLPDGFGATAYTLDVDGWTSGYRTE